MIPGKCFVLMPFSEPFNEYYSGIIAPSIRAAGFEPVRADEIYGTNAIIQDIFDSIREADVLIAEVTSRNPNVNYEMGVAHALNKPVIIISQSAEDIPFDYRHLRAIIYDTKRVNWASDLNTKIVNTLQNIKPTSMQFVTTLPIKSISINSIDIKHHGSYIRARVTGTVTPQVSGIRVWLLREDLLHSAGKFRVGGSPDFTDNSGNWQQLTNLWEAVRFRIHAIVTDPDSEELFKFYRMAFMSAREIYKAKVDPQADDFPGWPPLERLPTRLVSDYKEIVL